MYRSNENHLFIAGLALFAIVCGIGMFMFAPMSRNVVVMGHTWEHRQFVERWQENAKEGWTVPAGGKVTKTERRKYSESKYRCGTDSEGDPKYCTSNNYRDWYFYLIWEWTETKYYSTTGTENEPYNPDTSILDTTNPVNPERAGRLVPIYTVTLQSKERKEPYIFTTDYSTWKQLELDRTYVAQVSRSGNIYSVQTKG